MSASKFTPGPWAWNSEQQLVASEVLDMSIGEEFAQPTVIIETDSGFYPPRGADRDLLASAPDLLAALHEAHDALKSCYDVNDYPASGRSQQDKAIETAAAAIAKATGAAK